MIFLLKELGAVKWALRLFLRDEDTLALFLSDRRREFFVVFVRVVRVERLDGAIEFMLKCFIFLSMTCIYI